VPAQPRTKPGTRKLSEVARHVVQPTGIVSTGWPAVRDTCRIKLGITFDEWQEGAGRLILAKRANGKLAVMVGGVGMSLPRQVGKTYLLAGLIFGLCVNRPGLLVIWSAHHARTHGETFLAMQGFADRSKVKPYIERVYVGSGDEEIRFHNGSRILFGARERGFGRGVPGVDILVMDEAQILSDKALENMLATLNTSQFGLQLYIGTPPKPTDDSETFTRMRVEALSGDARDSVWIECGADPDASPDDRKQWAKANPSYPHRTPTESILRLRKRLKLEGFMREGLGIWDEIGQTHVFGPGAWEGCGVKGLAPAVAAIGLAVSIDRAWASIGAAGIVDGRLAVGVADRREGAGWLVPEAKRIQTERDCPVVIAGTGPAADLIPALEAAGVQLTIAKGGDSADACAGIFDAVRDKRLAHPEHPELNAAVAGAKKRLREDRWVWDRRNSAHDISPLEAVTLALWGANQASVDVWEVWT